MQALRWHSRRVGASSIGVRCLCLTLLDVSTGLVQKCCTLHKSPFWPEKRSKVSNQEQISVDSARFAVCVGGCEGSVRLKLSLL